MLQAEARQRPGDVGDPLPWKFAEAHAQSVVAQLPHCVLLVSQELLANGPADVADLLGFQLAKRVLQRSRAEA